MATVPSSLHQAASALDTDVLVVGAGLTGLALACGAAEQGKRVMLLDARMPSVHLPDNGWGLRVYALNPAGRALLESLGVWQYVDENRCCAVEAMDVMADAGGALTFSAAQQRVPALAWIVEEDVLKAALLQRAQALEIEIVVPVSLARLETQATRIDVLLSDGRHLSAQVVVGADGLRSHVRALAGIESAMTPYHQQGVVAHFACEKPHGQTARQWFLPDGEGILAWLPLPGRHVSMVWSAPQALAQSLCTLSAEELAEKVAQRGQQTLGALSLVSEVAGFPLNLMKVTSPTAARVALVGDAAHGVHPLAGQGVNLGFGDVAALLDAWQAPAPLTDAGLALRLVDYRQRRTFAVKSMQGVTDGLVHLFANQPLQQFRNKGFSAVDRCSWLKEMLVQSALQG